MSEELHVTDEVISWVVVSVYVPVAVNCIVRLTVIFAGFGVIAIDERTAAVTVNVVVPLTRPEVAVIVTLPVFTAVPRPSLPIALLMVAIDPFDDDHVAVAVRS